MATVAAAAPAAAAADQQQPGATPTPTSPTATGTARERPLPQHPVLDRNVAAAVVPRPPMDEDEDVALVEEQALAEENDSLAPAAAAAERLAVAVRLGVLPPSLPLMAAPGTRNLEMEWDLESTPTDSPTPRSSAYS